MWIIPRGSSKSILSLILFINGQHEKGIISDEKYKEFINKINEYFYGGKKNE